MEEVKIEKYLLLKPVENEEELNDKIRELFETEFNDNRAIKSVDHYKDGKKRIIVIVEYK